MLLLTFLVSVNSNLKEQWRFNRGDFLHDSVVHRGRALLNYQGSSDEANDLEKPMMSSAPVSRGYDSKSVIKATHPRMLNTSQKNTHPLKAKSAERKDLMVIRNKWDFLGDSKHKKRNSRRKDRKSKSRRKFERKQQNSTLDEQFYCPSSFNKTEVNRYVIVFLEYSLQSQIMKREGIPERYTLPLFLIFFYSLLLCHLTL